MRVHVVHATRYRYDGEVVLGPQLVRLRPARHARARLLSYDLTVQPAEARVRWQHDPAGNEVARITFEEPVASGVFGIQVEAAFELKPVNPFDFWVDDRCERVPFTYPDGLASELSSYRVAPEVGPGLAALLETLPERGYVTDFLVAVNTAVARRVRYVIRQEAGIQTSEETLAVGSGSCRDSARLLVDLFRARGLAARFVSGYLIQLEDEGMVPDLPRGLDHDAVDLHAWAEVYVPGAGWIGLDGTSGLLCGEGHVPLACTADPALAAPISGTASLPAAGFEFSMEVRRLGHEPRPSRPYTEEQWAGLLAAGERVDAALTASGLTLTCGGEPTWTSREEPAAPEWRTEALGGSKWSQGLRFAAEIERRVGQGAMALTRSGKLYPGESLPRWVIELVWRADGVPVWRDPSWLGLGAAAATGPVAGADDLERARRFGEALADQLGTSAVLVPGYEDPWVLVRSEADLPHDVDALETGDEPSEERRRLSELLRRGPDAPRGFAMPIQWQEGRWVTGAWTFRRGRMFLVPGDSPMGLRLPLDRITGMPAPPWYVSDPTWTPARPIAFDPRQRVRRAARADAEQASVQQQDHGGPGVLRSALCIEPRDGTLHVFLPPLPAVEPFLDLVAAIEDTAQALGSTVRLEGYAPPSDARLVRLAVSPDPGVLEVNVPPCSSVAEYAGVIAMLSDAANHAGLCTEKYQLDGRAAGSGGGNHVTLGGPTPLASPFLNQPHLLGSLLAYLQNHPSLSYLFTGLFVGPTSQAPRVDEARLDALHELELALAQVPAPGGWTPPWLVDRLFRNLLVDVAGNTHRTEICIDKLYDPAGVSGRQGLIELRAFEMPPHERMAVAQMLLVRALVARFARAPYDERLVRWGTSLHDRFMLPHFLWQDLEDVLDDLRRHDLPLDDAWFRPFLDHRCPLAGEMDVDGVHLEVRVALEPWPTLGDEPTGSVVARYVDSSLERLEVRVAGLVDERHVVAVNGLALPLVPTGTADEHVAGVRFRAWQPPHCLQPMIAVHHPLRFDVVDTWARRSLGACTYHVWHPEGRAFDEPPLTAFEAAARRAQRFTREGHASHPAVPVPTRPHPEHPFTLDLRLYAPDLARARRGVA